MKNTDVYKLLLSFSIGLFIVSIILICVNELILFYISLILTILGFILSYVIYKKYKRIKNEKLIEEKTIKIDIQSNNTITQYPEESTSSPLDKYIVPENYEVVGKIEKTTKIRGTYFYDIEEWQINEDDVIYIKHKPIDKYPENTDIYLSDGTILGHLMKEMAEDFVKKYGENFVFNGKIIEYYCEEEDNDGDEIESKVNRIIISFYVPQLKKIKRKSDQQNIR